MFRDHDCLLVDTFGKGDRSWAQRLPPGAPSTPFSRPTPAPVTVLLIDVFDRLNAGHWRIKHIVSTGRLEYGQMAPLCATIAVLCPPSLSATPNGRLQDS